MGRRRNFSREDVLTKAIPVFWKRGFADSKVEDLEATGVNKSGLYSEFSSKEEIFVESQALLKMPAFYKKSHLNGKTSESFSGSLVQ